MTIRRPATLVLLMAIGLAAQAAAVPIDPLAASRAVIASAAPAAASLLFASIRDSRLELIRERCESSFLDFVELMWPALDPGQPFVRGKVQEAIALHLEAVTAGKIKNLLANVPPGSTKTYLVNVFWPAWEWGPCNRPDLRFMAWSYSRHLAEKANADCRKVIGHPIYQKFWGDRFQLDTSSDAKSYYENDKGGWRRSSSIKGEATGFRADRLIWDDPHNVKHADSKAELEIATRWFARTLPTRVRSMTGDIDVKVPWWVRDVHGDLLDDPDDDRPVFASATVGIMQRVHAHDVSGIILKNPALGYEILLIEMRYKGDQHPARKLETWPASTIGYADWRKEIGDLADPVRYPESAIAELEAKLTSEGLGSDAIAAQLDQWPGAGAGSLFTKDWLPIIAPHDAPSGIDKRGWDWASSTAKKADQTATARVRRGTDKRFYLMDSRGVREGPAGVDKFVKEYHAKDPMDVEWSIPIDPGPTGKFHVAYVVRELTPGRYVTSSRELGKERSARPVSSQAEHGNFIIVDHPGAELTRTQMIDFPYGDHDDVMDAISRAFAAHVATPQKQENHGGFGGSAEDATPPPVTDEGAPRDFDF